MLFSFLGKHVFIAFFHSLLERGPGRGCFGQIYGEVSETFLMQLNEFLSYLFPYPSKISVTVIARICNRHLFMCCSSFSENPCSAKISIRKRSCSRLRYGLVVAFSFIIMELLCAYFQMCLIQHSVRRGLYKLKSSVKRFLPIPISTKAASMLQRISSPEILSSFICSVKKLMCDMHW